VREFVWVDSWQQQCCGGNFAVGSMVNWHVRPQVDFDPEWVTRLLGDSWSGRVVHHEEHHDEVEWPTISGQVVSISVVTCAREAKQHGALASVLMPVPGSGRLRTVQVADPWEPEPPESRMLEESFEGWIVELELAPGSA
jgi:hypothetical protein